MTPSATPPDHPPRRQRPTEPVGLYDPAFEHDSCGVAFVARLNGEPSHETLERAVKALANLEHRGAVGADPRTGDGAGILLQLPDEFFRAVIRARAAAVRRLRGVRGVPAARRRGAAERARAHPRERGRGRGAADHLLARRPDGARARRQLGARGGARRAPARRRRLGRPRPRPRRLRAQALRHPPRRGEARRRRARDPELLGAHPRLQGDARWRRSSRRATPTCATSG